MSVDASISFQTLSLADTAFSAATIAAEVHWRVFLIDRVRASTADG
jgi:hypothetical protein